MFFECARRNCRTLEGKRTRVQSKVAVHSIGRKAYCTVGCMKKDQVTHQRSVKVPS